MINLKEIGVRAQSKAEIYRTLVTEGELFLPPIKETSMLFVSQLAIGEKKVMLFNAQFSFYFHVGAQVRPGHCLSFTSYQRIEIQRSDRVFNYLLQR